MRWRCPEGESLGRDAAYEALWRVLNSVAGELGAEEQVRTIAEMLMDKGHAKGLEKGLARARAEDVLRILAARGVAVDEAERERILSCTDLATLDQWFDRALSATSLSDVMLNS